MNNCKNSLLLRILDQKETSSHRVVCLVDANEEDELGEEECRHKVLVDAVQVGAELPQDGQQYEGDQQSQQRGRHCGIRDYLQWQHISMLG